MKTNKNELYLMLGQMCFEKLDALAQYDTADAPELDFFLGDGKMLELLNQISSAIEETPAVPDSGVSEPEVAEEENVNIYSNTLHVTPVVESNAPVLRQEPVSAPRIQIQQEAAYAPAKPQSQAVCLKCNMPTPQEWLFCNFCGAKLTQATPKPTYAPVMTGDFFGIGEYVIDEKVSAFKFTNAYKVFDTAGRQIGAVEQQKVSGGAKAARLLMGSNVKAMQSFKLDITDAGGSVLVSIQRGGVGSKGGIRNISILSGSGQPIGAIKILFSWLNPKLEIHDHTGQKVGLIQGDWKGWNFNITDSAGNVIGTVNKKWAGAMKEIFTTADKYHVSISPNANGVYRQTIIAAAITIDMVLKESK